MEYWGSRNLLYSRCSIYTLHVLKGPPPAFIEIGQLTDDSVLDFRCTNPMPSAKAST